MILLSCCDANIGGVWVVTTVETQTLRQAAQQYQKFGQQLHEDVARAIPRCSLPHSAIPTPDFGYEASYAAAYSVADQASRAAADVFEAIGNALIRVANHYEGQDSENARMFGGKPIPPPTFPTSAPMPTSANLSDSLRYGGFEVGLGAALLWVTYSLLGAASAVPAVIVFPAGVAAMLCLKDPLPYFDAHGGWGELAGHLALAANQALPIAEKVTGDAKWTGDGATAFVNYVANDFSNALSTLNGVVDDMKSNTLQMGLIMAGADVAYLAGTAIITVGLLMAMSDPEPVSRESLGWTLAAEYVGEVAALVLEVAGVAVEATIFNSDMATQTANLKACLGEQSDSMTVNSMALSVQRMTEIQTWEDGGWTNPRLPQGASS
jgi:uncharacterized protein YukE